MEGAKVTFCVSLREGQLPLLDRTNVVHGNHRFIPKTGSMRLGFAFGYSGNTQGESVEIDNASLNLFSANIVECDKQPFRIRVKEEKDARLIPVVAIFPANFHANILKGNIYATNLPNSTVVVYARFDVPAKQERETGR